MHMRANVCSLVVCIVLRWANERKERRSQQMYGFMSSHIARWVHYCSDNQPIREH